ncbi:ROK family protein [Psychrobacillus sp.]|uniref:ROK family protein n=1 Tax=Psychrobacillus sp. TaxID=1871623 RepID=UPI0028BE502C|nr:ROK family protein [Psychrobacillus sp.]
MLGSIEAGGTKMNCAIGDEHGNIIKQAQFPTTTPEQNMQQFIEFFQTNPVDAIGIGAFGPVNVDRQSKQYGTILDTPKLAWRFFPFLQTLKQNLNIPIELQSDVNVAALGEAVHGSGKNDRAVLYITIGTGIGGGVVTNKQFLQTAQHPEMGHVWIKRTPEDTALSNCPFHTDCFEGLASGPAIEKRWNTNAKNLPADHPAWELEANYIAQGVYQMMLAHAPNRIIIGGGVMNQPQLLPKIKQNIKAQLNGYTYYQALANLEETIVLPELGDNAGLVGGLVFAAQIKNDKIV